MACVEYPSELLEEAVPAVYFLSAAASTAANQLQEFAFSLALLLTALLPFIVNHAIGKMQLLGGGEGRGKGHCLSDNTCNLI